MELMKKDPADEEQKSTANLPLLPEGVTDSTGVDMESLTSVMDNITYKLNQIKNVIA